MNNPHSNDYLLLSRKCELESTDVCRTNRLDLFRSIRFKRINPILQFFMRADDMEAIQMKFDSEV